MSMTVAMLGRVHSENVCAPIICPKGWVRKGQLAALNEQWLFVLSLTSFHFPPKKWKREWRQGHRKTGQNLGGNQMLLWASVWV